MPLRTVLRILAGYPIIILLALSPLLLVMIAGIIAQICGAQLDEGSSHPCMVAGMDIGPLLYSMFVMGWFSLITIPLGVIGCGLYTIYVLRRLFFDD